MLRAAQAVTIVPEPIRRIINAVGYLKFEDKLYVPAVSSKPVDRQGNPMPRPETVLLSTLRASVVTLADPHTPQNVRRRFHDNNPIPGAVWANDVLMNADEIMPPGYDLYNDFRRESMLIAHI